MATRIVLICTASILLLSLLLTACGKDGNETYEDVRDALMEEIEKGCKTIVDEYSTCVNRINEGEMTGEERKDKIDECVFNDHSYSKGEIDCMESCEIGRAHV